MGVHMGCMPVTECIIHHLHMQTPSLHGCLFQDLHSNIKHLMVAVTAHECGLCHSCMRYWPGNGFSLQVIGHHPAPKQVRQCIAVNTGLLVQVGPSFFDAPGAELAQLPGRGMQDLDDFNVTIVFCSCCYYKVCPRLPDPS